MSAIYVPSRFASQPQVITPLNYSGLAREARFVLNPAIDAIDLAHQSRRWTLAGNVAKAIDRNGQTYTFDGTADYLTYTGYDDYSGSISTYAYYFSSVGASDTAGHSYLSHATAGMCYVNAAGTCYYNGVLNNSGSISGWFSSSNRSIIFTTDGTAAGTKVYVDGVLSNLVWTVVPNAIPIGSKTLRIGSYVVAATADITANILVASAFQRTWGAAEAELFHESKGNALYKSVNRAIYYSTATSTTIDFFNPPLTGGMNSMQGNFQG